MKDFPTKIQFINIITFLGGENYSWFARKHTRNISVKRSEFSSMVSFR